MWAYASYRNQKYDDNWMKIWDARCRKWDMGCEKWEIRCWKWGFWMLTSHFPLPTWHFDKRNWIGSREMGNGIQMRILTTEVSTSVPTWIVILLSRFSHPQVWIGIWDLFCTKNVAQTLKQPLPRVTSPQDLVALVCPATGWHCLS